MHDVGSTDFFHNANDDDVIEIPQEKGKGKGAIDNFVKKGGNKQATLNRMWKKGDRENVVLAVCRFIYANALPLNVVKSPFFPPMMEAVAS